MKRNPSIELSRVLLMLGICMLHAFALRGRQHIADMLQWCVVAFVFVSGWHGIRFSWRKLRNLYGCGIYAVAVLYLLASDVSIKMAVKTFCGFWFLHGYVLLMLFSGALNILAQGVADEYRAQRRGPYTFAALGVLASVYVWAFWVSLPFLGALAPQSAGITTHSGITLMGVYLAARIVRLLDLKIQLKWHAVIVPLGVASSCLGLCHFSSPLAFVMAWTFFLFTKEIRLPHAVGAAASFVAPSMFCVYLLHANQIGGYAGLMRICEYAASLGFPSGIVELVSGLIVLVIGISLDLPRRAVAWLSGRSTR